MNINKKYLLIDNKKDISSEFKGLLTYAQCLLECLWEEPYLVYQILSNAKIGDVKNNLASFIGNNFYENLLSLNYVEDNLMYTISFLLKQEINNLSDINNPESFLKGTPCDFLLQQLCEKNDIRSFCKMNILNVVEHVESTFPSKSISFDLGKIFHNLQKEKSDEKNKNSKSKKCADFNDYTSKLFQRVNTSNSILKSNSTNASNISDLSSIKRKATEKDLLNEKKAEKDMSLFNTKYSISLTYKELDDKLLNFEKENNDNMIEYINYQKERSRNENNNNKKEIYENEKFINNLFNSSMQNDVYSIYVISFLKTIETINLLFQNLVSNSKLVPYSIKSICKIILILIKKKFPNINKVQQNAFISRFFFNKILLHVLENPFYAALINECMISKEIINNLKIISSIISQLCTGKLYTIDNGNGNYNSFNRYFIDTIPYVFQFFEDILLDISLPKNIENLINDDTNNYFKPSYFVDNPDEIINHRSIFFCHDDLCALIDAMNNCKDKLFVNKNPNIKILETAFNRLAKNMTKLNEIKNNKFYEDIKKNNLKKSKNNEINKIELKKFFLLNKTLINEKYSYISEMDLEKKYYNIKELKRTETPKDTDKNNIIKVKNLICSILYNYSFLKNIKYKKNLINDSISIFKELKNHIKMFDYAIDEEVPSEWYLDLLLEDINKIPKYYSENDYKLLYKELEEDINNSIKSFNLDILSSYFDKIKFAKRRKNIIQKDKKTVVDIYINTKVNYIIDYINIPCELYFCYEPKEKIIRIKEIKKEDTTLEFLDYMIFKEPKKGTKICNTIRSFTERFPNIIGNEIFIQENNKIFDVLKELKLPGMIDKYLDIVKNNITKLNIYSNQEEFNNINTKIYDFVTEKIYRKIYPSCPCQKDINIYNNCKKLAWTEPKHYLNNQNKYISNSFLHDIYKDFKEIDKQKSPRKKIIFMKDIFKCINNIGKLNGEKGKVLETDSQMLILIYAFIKARPCNIVTNCNYMELFIKKEEQSKMLLTQLIGAYNQINEMTYINLYGVTKEEFDSKFIDKE